MVEPGMNDASSGPGPRRKIRKPAVTLLLTLLPVTLAGYVFIAPAPLRAKTLTRTPAAAKTVTPAPQPATLTSTQTASVAPASIAAVPPGERPAWSGAISGRVLDQRREPLANASVVVGGRELRTGADGTFTTDPPAGSLPLLIKHPGYEKVTVHPTASPIEVVLKPQVIRAAYLTYYGFTDKGIRNRVLELVGRTELNAIVVDVKGDRGWIVYPTEVPLAVEIGAQGPATKKDFDAVMADLKARGVYTIARIVTFKDNVLATHRPDLAIIDTRTGKPWTDREHLAWVDPFREEVWRYNIAIAQEAVRRGFDEVQFDYVRFPTDGKLGAARYAKPNNHETRLPTITAFLDRARREIGPLGAFVSADVFGYTAFNENDTDIGQRIEELAPHVDYLCPMVYPSGYQFGIPGYRNPVAHPYEVVFQSVKLIRKRSSGVAVRVRPWLQDFRDYAFGRKIYGAAEVRAQIKAADEAGGTGFMLWNPKNTYTGGALRQKATLASR
jgi:hypothetical protein